MFDELELLQDTPAMQHVLAWYVDRAARDPEAWRERQMHVEGVEPHDLVRWHGELLAIGWVELNVGQRGCGYRAPPSRSSDPRGGQCSLHKRTARS
jgi:hypothetical protein